MSNHPELPCNSCATIIATDRHPEVPEGYVLVIDEHWKAHLTGYFRVDDYDFPVYSRYEGQEGPASIPDDIFIPGDIVRFKSFDIFATVVSPQWDRVVVNVTRLGRRSWYTSDVVKVDPPQKEVVASYTRWDIIEGF